MRILILGAGKMGSFFTDILSFQHETAVFDVNPHQLRFVYNTYRFTTLEEIKEFEPELVINAATVKYTLDAFRQVLPVLPKDCIISDIASHGIDTILTVAGICYFHRSAVSSKVVPVIFGIAHCFPGSQIHITGYG